MVARRFASSRARRCSRPIAMPTYATSPSAVRLTATVAIHGPSILGVPARTAARYASAAPAVSPRAMPGGDQGQREEERAGGATGEGDEDAHEQHGERALDDQLERVRHPRREELVEDERVQGTDHEQGEDRALVRAPQVGDGDDRRDDEQEHPRPDADDTIEGRRPEV